jgi:predicted esterase
VAPCYSHSVGTYVASETAYVLWGSRAKAAAAQGVVYCQGSHSLGSALKGDTTLEYVVESGFVAVCGDLSQTTSQGTFGNDTARTRVGQLKSFVQGASSPLVAASGKVHLLGASGGAAAAINYARANPTLVASMYLVVPLVDLADVHDNDRGGYAAEIETAYGGGAGYTAAVASHNPSASGNQAALSGVPMKIAYSTNDTLIPSATVTAYRDLVNAAGGTCTITSLGAVGHAATGLDPADVTRFFQEHP